MRIRITIMREIDQYVAEKREKFYKSNQEHHEFYMIQSGKLT